MHLIKSPSGILHFRMRIPKKAQPYLQGRTEIKRSLMTKKKRIAQPLANQLYERNMTALRNILLELVNGTKVTIDQETPEIEQKTANELLASISATTAIASIDNLPELSQQYLNDTNPSVAYRTQTEKIRAIEMYLDLHKEINHSSANAFSDILKKLPPRFKLDDILKLSELSHNKTLSWKSHNKYISAMSGWNTWLIKRGHLEKNYFSGLMMKRTQRSDEERDPLDPNEVRKLLKESSKFTGYKYWLPRLGLYTGCRLNELSQLYLDDIFTVDGFLCLNITDAKSDQHLKNMSSKRTIPIHPNLVDKFKEYLKTVTDSRVFPDLSYTKGNRYAGMSSKWFLRFRNKIGLDKDFHSLRHTFSSSLSAARVEDSVLSDLLGHSKPGETGRYTGRKTVDIMMDAIKLLKF